MSAILDKIKLDPREEQQVRTQEAVEYIKLMLLQEQINQELKQKFEKLNEDDKHDSSQFIKRKFSIPDYVTVKDASEIIEVSPQMVRKYCSDSKLNAVQSMPNSGKWRIETTQLMTYPGWSRYMEKRAKIKDSSLKIAKFMNENIDNLFD